MKKRIKSKMSINEFLKKPKYKAILYLLMSIGDKEGGLRQAHFRYALMEDHGLSEDTINKITKGIYGKYMEDSKCKNGKNLQNNKLFDNIDYNIKSNKHLTNYLSTLLDRGLIKRYGNHPNRRYKISPKYSTELTKNDITKRIERWKHNEIIEYEIDEEYDRAEKLVLFGFSKNTLLSDNNSQEENEMIKKCLDNILINARKLLAIKNNKMKKTITEKEYYTKFLTSNEDEKKILNQFEKKTTLDLYYRGSRFPNRITIINGKLYKSKFKNRENELKIAPI